MKKKVLSLSFILFVMTFFISLNTNVEAFTQVTSQEAYYMLSSGEATLLDVRTLEECAFAGSPALDSGGEPVACLIPWKLFGGIDDNGQIIYKDNPDFNVLVEQTFGSSKNHPLIVMCKFGGRSTYAANRLEQLGFTKVSEIDNKLKERASPPGGRGGFQGSDYQAETRGYYNGYSGYPGRLPSESTPSSIKVATVTDLIENENDSVSWMDTGLPITQKVDPKKIPKLKKVAPALNENKNILPLLQSSFPSAYQGYQATTYQSYQTTPYQNYQTAPNLGYQTTPYQNYQTAPNLGYQTGIFIQQPTFSTQGSGFFSTLPQQSLISPVQTSFPGVYQDLFSLFSLQSQSTVSSLFTNSPSTVNTSPIPSISSVPPQS